MSADLADITKDVRSRMDKSLDKLRQEFLRMRTNRANAAFLDRVIVPYYGADVPLSHAANVTVSDASTLMVQPWERKMIPVIEKAIRAADLGLNPIASGEVIQVPIPKLTEERLKELTRLVRSEAENARISIRNIRRNFIQNLRTMVKNEHLAKDEEKRGNLELQKLTDQFINDINQLLAEKEHSLTEF